MKNKYDRFQFPVVAVDAAIFTVKEQKLCVLLVQTNKEEYKGFWALPGGLMQSHESLETTLERVVKEKANLHSVHGQQLATYGDPERDPFGRVISVAYLALLNADARELKTTKDYDDIQWVSIDDLPKLAYDHRRIIEDAVERLRSKLLYTNIACHILPEEFTLSELQNLYELILEKEFDKRNFRKKILALGILQKTEKMRSGSQARPAALYRFSQKADQEVEMI